MPIRIVNLIGEMFASALATFIAVLATLPALSADTVWDKQQLRMYCLLGSIGGAWLAITIFPPHTERGNVAQKLAFKFLSSSVSGLLFTPIAIRWQNWPLDVDVILAVSGIVAFLSWSLLKLAPALLERWLRGKLPPE